MNIGIIVLAAGASKRMGQSKQLLKVGDATLLQHSVQLALSTGMKPVIVVLGSNEKMHREALKKIPVGIVVNKDWASGMGSSLKSGLSEIEKSEKADAVIVMVCDQPLLSRDHLNALKEQYISTHKRIIASYYAGTAGVPALFDRSLFADIHSLSNDEGAKKIILQHPNETVGVVFPEGSVDLDTPEDYKKFTDNR
ncbi:MAG TPA: nucleotidyltransferase family protein [Cyclobacteriaceae bacterium]|nr:nucleotidyltransferase family protein [Cyclobacteriaceae bacterium]